MTAIEPRPDDVGVLDAQSFVDETEERLAAIEQALSALDEGRYGHCEVCGQQIDGALLVQRPSARWCVAHEDGHRVAGLLDEDPRPSG